MTRMAKWTLIGLAALASWSPVAGSAGETQGSFFQQRVHLARGAHDATLQGQVSQNEAILHLIGAKAGQTMTVTLDGDDAKTSFELSGPKDSSGQAKASSETEWTGTLPDNRDYKIFVFAQHRVKAPFTLKIALK